MATLGPPSLWSQEAHGSDVYQQSLSAGGREEKMVALPSDRGGRGKLDRGVGLDFLASQQDYYISPPSPPLPLPTGATPATSHSATWGCTRMVSRLGTRDQDFVWTVH